MDKTMVRDATEKKKKEQKNMNRQFEEKKA